MPKAPRRLDPADPVESFAIDLRKLHRHAGSPSLAALGRAMACSHATVSAYLSGRRLPGPQQLESFVLACKGNTADWLQRLEGAREQLDGLPATEIPKLAVGGLDGNKAEEHRQVFGNHPGAVQNVRTESSSRQDHPVPGLRQARQPSSSAPSLLQTFQNVAAALRNCLIRDTDGRPVGWPHHLGESPTTATAVATAYGIRTMLLLEDALAADLIPVGQSLAKMHLISDKYGYATRVQAGSRPEATAIVLDTLRRFAATEDFDAYITWMERGLGDFERRRPLILATMLETSLLLAPRTNLVEAVIDSLLAARRPYEDLLLWPEKSEPLPVDPAPSVAHTARAVRALASVQTIQPSDQVQEALAQAVGWLAKPHDLHNAHELIERTVNDEPQRLYVRHFTGAWVVKALISAGVPTAHPAVSNAVTQIWKSYGGDTTGLWAWDNGDLPIWMTFDAVEALRLAHLGAPSLARSSQS
jgi:hypothetical protein